MRRAGRTVPSGRNQGPRWDWVVVVGAGAAVVGTGTVTAARLGFKVAVGAVGAVPSRLITTTAVAAATVPARAARPPQRRRAEISGFFTWFALSTEVPPLCL